MNTCSWKLIPNQKKWSWNHPGVFSSSLIPNPGKLFSKNVKVSIFRNNRIFNFSFQKLVLLAPTSGFWQSSLPPGKKKPGHALDSRTKFEKKIFINNSWIFSFKKDSFLQVTAMIVWSGEKFSRLKWILLISREKCFVVDFPFYFFSQKTIKTF